MAVAFSEHEAGQAWAHVLERARVDLPETTIVMWFDDVRAVALTDQALSLAVPSPLVKERLQHNHLHLIEEAAAEAEHMALEKAVQAEDAAIARAEEEKK